MITQARVDKAEAETIERVKAERQAAIQAVVNWVGALPKREQVAYWRWSTSAMKREPTADELKYVLDGQAEMTPEDVVLAEDVNRRMPPELMARVCTAHAVRLPGDPVERQAKSDDSSLPTE